MSKLKVNSTMGTKEAESCAALKSQMDAENRKNPLNTEGSGVALTKASMQNLPALRFHRVYGEYIKMSPDYCMARLEVSMLSGTVCSPFTKRNECLVFSSRPIAVDEKVYLCLETVPRTSVGIGLTNCDPNNIMDLKSCSGMRNDLKFFSLNDVGKVHTIQLCVKQSGEVTFFLKDENMSYSFKNSNIKGSLWVVIELTFGVKIAKFIDSPKGNETEMLDILSIEEPLPVITNAFVESSVQSELEFKKSEAFKKHLRPSTSDTPAELIQPVSSTDVKNTRKSIDSDVIYFVQIVANQLNGIPEDKRMKCMQKILEALDTLSK